MPNGGSDNCGTCWFNAINEGEARHREEPKQDASEFAHCDLRDVDLPWPFWVYCANHQHHSRERLSFPVGPIYISRPEVGSPAYERTVFKPSPDTKEIRAELLRLLSEIRETPREEYPSQTTFDDEVIKQLMVFREERALADLRRVAGFAPGSKPIESMRDDTDRMSTVGCALEALASFVGDDALPEIREGLRQAAGPCREGEDYDWLVDRGWRLRVHVAAALRHLSLPAATEFLTVLGDDLNPRVAKVAQEVVTRVSEED
jgi:hypothetical protein